VNQPPADNSKIREFIKSQEEKSLLKFMTCGSVDDGKSTLVGRLLYDTKQIFDDQLSALKNDSARYGTMGDDLDVALLVDGLEAERQQGITIDVAYRFFSTSKRKFIVADTPGHEEYTRNMATGASTADLAVVLVDARQGVLKQTQRHSCIASLLGVKHVVLAVNKMDLVDFDPLAFDKIANEYQSFASRLNFLSLQSIPLAARFGDNVICRSERMPWYKGPALLQHLETVPVDEDVLEKPFRFPVQYISRPNMDFRGVAGQVASGRIRVGDTVQLAKSGTATKVKDIVVMDGSLAEAREGQAITIVLHDQVDASRGDILFNPGQPPNLADQFQAHVIWFNASPLLPGRSYILRTEADSIAASVSSLKYKIDVHTLDHIAAKLLNMNEFGVCNFSVQAAIAFDSYKDNRTTGAFVLIDPFTNMTVGGGMIDFPLRRAENIHWQAIEVTKRSRAELMNQQPAVFWFTGLSGSGKSTIANRLEKLLHASGRHTILLDGDNVRHGLNRDLGFTEADRVENIRRIAEVAKLMTDAGLIVIVAFISPFKSERQLARELMEPGEFVEVYIDTPLEECITRDPKGLYRKALSGEITNFTGIDSPYEPPENPEIRVHTVGVDADEIALDIKRYIDNR
jgi:bifunctional enzyme CysN/CysC